MEDKEEMSLHWIFARKPNYLQIEIIVELCKYKLNIEGNSELKII